MRDILRVDDSAISDADGLLRRILPQPEWMKMEQGVVRPSSMAFLDRRNEVSVFLSRLKTIEVLLASHPSDGAAEVEARVPRAHEQLVASAPDEGEDGHDPAHALICPKVPLGTKKQKAAARAMAMAAVIRKLPKPL